MDISIWSAVSVILKFSLYLLASIAIGASFIQKWYADEQALAQTISRYLKPCLWAGVLTSVAYFFVQVGTFAEQGVAGLVNQDYVIMLWQSPLGSALVYQSLGFIFIWLSTLKPANFANKNVIFFSSIGYVIGSLSIARSFSLVGHVAELGELLQLFLSLHFICVAWWLGALFPLRNACQFLEAKSLQRMMLSFGKVATLMVAILLSAGVTLLYVIADGSFEIFKILYGWVFIGKLLLVSAILMLALYHKLKLVPSLGAESGAIFKLKKSISREIFVGLAILVVTSLLTTTMGPAT